MLQGRVDPRDVGVPAPIGTILQNLVTGALYAKIGNGNTDWGLITSLNVQSFAYTFQGTEPGFGTQNVVVPLQRSMPGGSGNFQAIVTDAGRVDQAQVFYTAPQGGYIDDSHITVNCTGIPVGGDKIFVFAATFTT
jgi:hypothetical protein